MKKQFFNYAGLSLLLAVFMGINTVQAQWTGSTTINGTISRLDRVGIGGINADVTVWDPFEAGNLIVSGESNSGKLIYHWRSGQVARFNANDQWIGIGQPAIDPANLTLGLVPAYGIRNQWGGSAAIFALTESEPNVVRDAVLQWGPDKAGIFSFQFLNSLTDPADRNRIMEFNSEGDVFIGRNAVAAGTTNPREARLDVLSNTASSDVFTALFINQEGRGNFRGGTLSIIENGTRFCTGVVGRTNNDASTAVLNAGVRGIAITTGTGTSTDNVGVLGKARGATNNWAGFFKGRVLSTRGFITSDQRLKKNIVDIGANTSALQTINSLRPVSYDYKTGAELSASPALASLTLENTRQVGFIAQEVATVVPGLIDTVNVYDDDDLVQQNLVKDSVLAIDYVSIIPYLVGAVQELAECACKDTTDQGPALRSQALETKVEALEDKVARLEQLVLTLVQEQTAADQPTDARTGRLLQNAPNPFNDRTQIGYVLPAKSQNGQIAVYDLQGAEVARFDNLSAGQGSVTLQGRQLQAGIYLYALMANGKVISVKRMVLTR